MLLSFAQANLLLAVVQVGYAVLNVVQAYVLVDLHADEFGFQFVKSCIGSTCFLILLYSKEQRFCEQISFIWSDDFFYVFMSCCVSLAIFELSLIVAMNDLGPTMVAIGIASSGSVAYIVNIVANIEQPTLIKFFSSTVTVSGAIMAIYFTWADTQSENVVRGAIAMGSMILSLVSFFTLQKFLYPTFSVMFVTGCTLFTSCSLTLVVALIWGSFTLPYSNSEFLACLLYSSLIGQFTLSLGTNSANQVLSAPMILLYSGMQPIFTPLLDICRTCYFPASSGECAFPDLRILFAALLVTCGLCLYAWGEYESQMMQKQNGGYARLEKFEPTPSQRSKESPSRVHKSYIRTPTATITEEI